MLATEYAVLPNIGGIIPLLVHPSGSRAVIDKRDPRVKANAVWKSTEQAEKARFDSELS